MNLSLVKFDPRIQAIHAKVAIQLQIRREGKARARKAAKALRNAWKRDSHYRRRLKSRKQADKALQAAGNKIAELRREEEEVWGEMESTW
ncbi:hypothetical protein MMC22_002767 [Lobaria immixta]|nr:hypothetical protein [Lobaria immixta]